MTTEPTAPRAAEPFETIGVMGAGAWGTALALASARAGRAVILWARRGDLARDLAERRENDVYLPGIPLDERIVPTGDLADLAGCEAVLLAAPSQNTRAMTGTLAESLRPGTPLLVCSKGIEREGDGRRAGALVGDAVTEAAPGHPVAILSGPTFAGEVARRLPTAVTLACADAALGARLVASLGQRSFRPYLSADLAGAQVGGAVKNVIAIACGIVVGRQLGENARAALVTRGLAEMARLGDRIGARPETLMGLSGLGDLTLTCGSAQSRNMSLGTEIGAGRAAVRVLAGRRTVSEGVHTASSVTALAARLGVDMPICAAVDAIVNRGADPDRSIATLLSRPFTTE